MRLAERSKPVSWRRGAVFALVLACCCGPLAAQQYIEGYTDGTSYRPGETIGFHASTTSPTYTIEIFRDSLTPTSVATTASLPGAFHPTPSEGWLGANWPASHSLVVPASWTSGSYYAIFMAEDGTRYQHHFAVLEANPGSTSRIAFLMNFNTRNAYNDWGGKSLHVSNIAGDPDHAVRVSFLRPRSRCICAGQSRVHSWLEGQGYSLEYMTEWDVQEDPGLLLAYDVVVLANQHQYVSRRLYDALQIHHDRGAHLAFFSANDLWWQVRFEDSGNTMVGYRNFWRLDPFYGRADELVTTQWRVPPLDRPGEALQGIAYQQGSFAFQPADFLVQDSTHWAFAGTSPMNGEALGSLLAGGATDDFDSASPPLADRLLSALRDQPRPGVTPPVASVNAAASYYEDTADYGFPGGNGGQVFAGGTTHWYLGLRDSEDVRRLSSNVIQRMLDSPVPPPGNQAPMVFAGLDQTVISPNVAILSGDIWDDGRPDPPGVASLTWSRVSGPGPVSFGDTTALDTTASFSSPGVYVLRLTADDGDLSASDDVTVSFNTLDLRISSSTDDAEETPSGSMELISPDLDLGDRIVGIRFSSVDVPDGPVIVDVLEAYVQFQADKTNSTPTSIVIRAHDTGSAPSFSDSIGDITSRVPTTATVSWSPPGWTAGAAGSAQRTPDLTAVIQEVIDRPDWVRGGSVALILSGSGLREAKSYERHAAPAATLHLKFGFEPCAQGTKDVSGNVVSDERTFRACTVLAAGDFEILGSPSPGKVTFAAGQRIVLRDNFVVRAGGEFAAVIDAGLLP